MPARFPVAYRPQYNAGAGFQSPVALPSPANDNFPKPANDNLPRPSRPSPIGRSGIPPIARQAIRMYGRRVLGLHPLVRIGLNLWDLTQYVPNPGLVEGQWEFIIPQTGGWTIHGSCAAGAAFVFGTNSLPVPASENPPLDFDCFSNQQAAPTAAGNALANSPNTRHINYYGPMPTRPGFEEKKICVTRPSQGKQYRPHMRERLIVRPDVDPLFDPHFLPIGQPVRSPKKSYPSPRTADQISPLNRPRTGAVGSPIPRGAPRQTLGPGEVTVITHPSSPPRTVPRYEQKVPPPYVKEQKLKVVVGGAVASLIGFVTESADFIIAIWRALPAKYRSSNPTIQSDLRDIYNHFDKIDWTKAISNLLINEVQDRAIGAFGRRAAKANKAFGEQGFRIQLGLGSLH